MADSVGFSRRFAAISEERLKLQNYFRGVQKTSGSGARLPSPLQELHGGGTIPLTNSL